MHAVRSGGANGTEVFEYAEVEVDGAVTNVAATKVGNKGLAEAVQERAAEQDGDAGGAREHINLDRVGQFQLARGDR